MTDNEIYRKLQQHLDKFPIGFPGTESGVEIEILEYFFSLEEAKAALCLSLITTPPEAAARRYNKKFGEVIKIQEMEKLLEKMFMKGVIDRNERGGKFRYRNAMLVIGMFEFNVDHLKRNLWKSFTVILMKLSARNSLSQLFLSSVQVRMIKLLSLNILLIHMTI